MCFDRIISSHKSPATTEEIKSAVQELPRTNFAHFQTLKEEVEWFEKAISKAKTNPVSDYEKEYHNPV